MELQHKIDKAVKLLQSFGKGKVVEVCYSGGKDSDVILELVKMAGIEYRAIYKNTTIDPPYTIAHCKSKGAEIIHPKRKFFDLVKYAGLPTVRARFCCRYLKEYKVLDDSVQGIRRCESQNRAKNYQEPIICRIYGNKKSHVNVCLPILEWSDKDVENFIELRGIKCHPLYYDENGKFHVERRLGCFGCPMKTDKGVGDFKRRPKFFKRLVQCAKIWYDTHPDASSRRKFDNVYELVYNNLFCKTYGDFIKAKQPDLFGETLDCKKYLEEYFNIEL